MTGSRLRSIRASKQVIPAVAAGIRPATRVRDVALLIAMENAYPPSVNRQEFRRRNQPSGTRSREIGLAALCSRMIWIVAGFQAWPGSAQ